VLTEEEKAAAAREEAEKKAAEAEKALDERIAKTVNSALTSHLKRFKGGLTKDELEAHLEQREKDAAEKRAAAEEEERKKKEGTSDKTAPEIVALRKQAEASQKELDALKKDAAAAKAKALDSEERSLLTETLSAGGVKDARVKHAVSYLRGEGLVRRDDDGELVFVQRGKGGKEEEIDLGDGLAEWLKTEDGMHFLPPSGANGAGTEVKKRTGRKGGDEKPDLKATAAAALRDFQGRG
jgi:hypothetical protein